MSGGNDVNLVRDIYLTKSMVAAGLGDFREAYFQHKKFYEMDSTFSSLQRNAHFAELETIHKTQKKEAENTALKLRLNRQKMWLASILSAALLLAGIVWLQHKRLIIKTLLLETETKLLETERQRLMDEKNFHQANLQNFTQSLREKNDLIESLKRELDSRSRPDFSADAIEEKEHLLHQMSQATILTEEQWRNFRQKFERVHTGFFQKFGQAVADATEAELRLAALTKLELTNAEIASTLGISPESVIKTRYRLRKKLSGADLTTFVMNL